MPTRRTKTSSSRSQAKPWSRPPVVEVQPIKIVAVLRRIPQIKFARETGISQRRVHYTWNGVWKPTPDFVAKAVAYFDLPAAELFRAADIKKIDKAAGR